MRRFTWRSLAALMVGAFIALLTVVAPSASAAAPSQDCNGYPTCVCPTLTVSTTVPQGGEAIRVGGENFLPDKPVKLILKPVASNTGGTSHDLGTTRTNDAGSFSTVVTMPQGAFGSYDIVAGSGVPAATAQCPADPSAKLTLGSGSTDNNSPNGGPGSTAFTGLNVTLLLLIAAALIAIGIAATRRGRRVPAGIR